MNHIIAIDKPMVLVPLDEYERLLEESGEKPTPKLCKEIARARNEFRKRKTIKWESIKHELGI